MAGKIRSALILLMFFILGCFLTSVYSYSLVRYMAFFYHENRNGKELESSGKCVSLAFPWFIIKGPEDGYPFYDLATTDLNDREFRIVTYDPRAESLESLLELDLSFTTYEDREQAIVVVEESFMLIDPLMRGVFHSSDRQAIHQMADYVARNDMNFVDCGNAPRVAMSGEINRHSADR
ncbi:MAG: hypothetical protein LAT61_08975 [Alcanivorax sp.]|nr:hypothetical protein [Alcanivorax sp.]